LGQFTVIFFDPLYFFVAMSAAAFVE
jgi:hypothetical protein